MKHHQDLFNLIDLVEGVHENWNDSKTYKLDQYYRYLIKSSEKTSLISKKSQQHIIKRHFLLSFLFADLIKKESGNEIISVLDLGSGNGFPGIILAICFENAGITMIDSNRKKILFLKKIKTALGLNSEIVYERIENWNPGFKKFDFLTALAFAPMEKLIRLAGDYIQAGSKLLTIKGQDFKKEIEKIPATILIESNLIGDYWSHFNPEIKDKRLIEVKRLR